MTSPRNPWQCLAAPFDRRAFLKGAGRLAAALSLPAGIAACGDDRAGLESSGLALQVDPGVPWWLQNNFAPVFDELDAVDLPVRGRIPAALDGTYVRNGSNPQNADSPHWFFGDGMLHGVRIQDGRGLWYRNRYVDTPLYRDGVGFGDPDRPPLGPNNQGNVSCIWHADKLLTSGEVGFPHQIDPADLSTIGPYDFGGALMTSFTAHPAIDPATGHLHFFGYNFFPPYVTYLVADATGQVIHTQPIDVAGTTMMHSFVITDRDAVFWEFPVVFSLEDALDGAVNPFSWDPSYGARIGVLPLGGMAEEIRWVEIEPCYVFHPVNAFRSGSEVVIDVCRHDRMFAGEDLGQTDLTIRRWRVDTAGMSFQEEIVTDRLFELPSHDRRFTGRPHRYGWFVESRDHPDTVDLAGTGRIDYQTGDVRAWDPGATRHANEAFFVPRGAGEGGGWLLTYVWDHAQNESVLAILDALHVEDGPVAEIVLPRRVPDGFHGIWIPA